MTRVGPLVERVTATLDPIDGLLVAAMAPGPAGAATLAVLDGTAELCVDVAEPENLVFVHLGDPTHPGRDRLLGMLLGEQAAAATGDLRGGDPPTVLWAAPDPGDDLARRRRGITRGLALVGRAVLAVGETSAAVGTADAVDHAVAVGLVEAGILMLEVDRELRTTPGPVRFVQVGLERWEALAGGAFDRSDPAALGLLLRRHERWGRSLAAAGLADEAARLTALMRSLEGEAGGRAARGGAPVRPRSRSTDDLTLLDRAGGAAAPLPLAAAAPAAAPVAEAMAKSSEGTAPPIPPEVRFGHDLAPSEPRIIGVHRDGHHLVVHAGGLPPDVPVRSGDHSGGTWLRVFDSGTPPVLLAMAPFGDSQRPWRTAVALIPPEVRSDDLLVDVTTEASAPWLADGPRSIASAARLGATAARASRRGDADASTAWDRTAEAWRVAGDDSLASIAESYSERQPLSEALLVDLLTSR